jgi:hypothetical protein
MRQHIYVLLALVITLICGIVLFFVRKRSRCDEYEEFDRVNDFNHFEFDPDTDILYAGGATREFVDLYCVCRR